MLFCEPLRRPLRSQLRGQEPARVRGLSRPPERRLLRCHGRVQLEAQLQEPEQVQVRMDERVQLQGPVITPEPGQERPPFPVLERRLLRTQERGPYRGQEFPPRSGG
jgi:hypothetical protein